MKRIEYDITAQQMTTNCVDEEHLEKSVKVSLARGAAVVLEITSHKGEGVIEREFLLLPKDTTRLWKLKVPITFDIEASDLDD